MKSPFYSEPNEALMPSSSGRELTTIRFDLSVSDRIPLTLCLESEAWPETGASRALEKRHEVTVGQLATSRPRLEELIDRLRGWSATRQPFKVSFAISQHDELFIGLSAIPQLITTLEKPAFTIEYLGPPHLRMSWSYVVDQTCVAILLQGLESLSR